MKHTVQIILDVIIISAALFTLVIDVIIISAALFTLAKSISTVL